jgi:hypothetical protein
MLLMPAGGLGGGGHAGGHRLRDAEEQPQAVAEHLAGSVRRAEGAEHRPVCGVGLGEFPDPLAQHLQPGFVAGDDGEIASHDLHVVQRVSHQRLEQVFLVREVQVERTVRDAGPAHHVIHAHALETAVLELDHARFEQAPDGLPALSAQLAVLGRGTAAQRRS